MTNLFKKIAFKIVYKELSKNELFMGKFEPNEIPQYMYGIHKVMGSIAQNSGGKTFGEFAKQFSINFEESANIARAKY